MEFKQFGFGKGDDNIGGRTSRFKQRGNEVDRLSFGWFPRNDDGTVNFDAETPMFAGVEAVYIPGVGRVVADGPEFVELAGKPSKYRIGTVVVKWPTDPTGKVSAGRLRDGEWSILLWDFTGFKYKQIGSVHQEWPLGHHDLKVSCTEPKYQNQNFTPCPQNLLRDMSQSDKQKEIFEEIMGEVDTLVAKIKGELARELTIDEVRQRLARNNGPGGGGHDNSPGGASRQLAGASGEQVDSMIDDFLGNVD